MKKALFIPLSFTLLMLLINIVQFIFKLDFSGLGIHPKDNHTLLGILTSPLIHGSWNHLLSNTIPILILGSILFLVYDKIAIQVWVFNYCFTGLLVWLFARDATYHIGASGIIYGLASFLLFSGFIRMDIRSIAIASGVAIFYGGMVWGILPIQPGVSWESHLFGGITGLILAYLYRNKNKDSLIHQHEHELAERKTFDDYINQ